VYWNNNGEDDSQCDWTGLVKILMIIYDAVKAADATTGTATVAATGAATEQELLQQRICVATREAPDLRLSISQNIPTRERHRRFEGYTKD
jgi:hypothetical protein